MYTVLFQNQMVYLGFVSKVSDKIFSVQRKPSESSELASPVDTYFSC